jgi:hypothetical protein
MRFRRTKCLAGTFRAGKGTLDLYLEGENHLYNKSIYKNGYIYAGIVPGPGDLEFRTNADADQQNHKCNKTIKTRLTVSAL